MYKLNIRQVSYALSEALDLVGVDDLFHGKRVAYMASKLCVELEYSQEQIDDIINIGMLHDCGVSNTDIHHNLVTQLDWEGSQNHCTRGAKLVNTVHFYKAYSDVILYHHTHWCDLEKLDISEDIKRNANIILLVDRVDALRAQQKNHKEIIEILHEQKSHMFSPELVDLFDKVSSPESFWFFLESNNIELFLHEWINEDKEREYAYKHLKEIAFMFANIVDAKSSFTGEHSLNVSKGCVFIAKKLALTNERIEILELSALLHDLGKLRVADEILEKKGPLSVEEREIMDRHGFDSEMILRQIDGFKEIAELASSHHETLDGKGYPYQKKSEVLSIESRVLMLGDVFQALVQKRPYRDTLDAKSIMNILYEMKEEGKIDVIVLGVIEENLKELYALAAS